MRLGLTPLFYLNERLHGMFAMLDMETIDLRANPNPKKIIQVLAILRQIWKNIRTLIYNNERARHTLGLLTPRARSLYG